MSASQSTTKYDKPNVKKILKKEVYDKIINRLRYDSTENGFSVHVTYRDDVIVEKFAEKIRNKYNYYDVKFKYYEHNDSVEGEPVPQRYRFEFVRI